MPSQTMIRRGLSTPTGSTRTGSPAARSSSALQIELANRDDCTSDEYRRLSERVGLLLEEHRRQWTAQFITFADAIRDGAGCG